MTTESVLGETEWPEVEIIVVDDGSTDDSILRYRRRPDPRLRVLRSGGLGVAKARNLGAQHARGEYIVFLDAHCRVSPDWLHRFALALAEPDVALISPCFTRLDEPEPRGAACTSVTPRSTSTGSSPAGARRRTTFGWTSARASRCGVTYSTGSGGTTRASRAGLRRRRAVPTAWTFGWRVKADPVAVVAHHFRESRGYEVDDADVVYNLVRMLALHVDEPELSAIPGARGPNPNIAVALDLITTDGTLDQRYVYDSMRTRTARWFFDNINGAPTFAA